MPGFDLLITNLLSPIVLAFALGPSRGSSARNWNCPNPS